MTMVHPDIERIALLGWHVYPCLTTHKAACFEGASDAATCDLDTIEGWHKRFNGPNWRVKFGPSGLWGLDCDTQPLHKHDGVAALKRLTETHGALPMRPTMRSGGGGIGIMFKHNGEPIIGASGYPAPGIDPRRGRQSQTIPPSVHVVTRQPYRWLVPPWEVNPPTAPDWLLQAVLPPPEPEYRAAPVLPTGDRARTYALAALRNCIGRVATAAPGAANDTLNQQCWALARFLGDGSLSEAEVRDCMLAASRARAIPIREAMATIGSALRSRRRG